MSPSISIRPFAVIGATGQQGGAVVTALLESGAAVRALVRDPDAASARRLADRGVEVVTADQEDAAALERALQGVAALFFHTTFTGDDGPAGEVRRGITIADSAARAGVPRVVYSSVGGAERGTGVPHFESKGEVERHLDGLVPSVHVRPAFFMENLAQQLAPDANGEIILRLPMPGDVPVQMIAVRDIGRVAARLLRDYELIEGAAVEIAGDERSMDDAACIIQAVTGAPARFEEVPLDVLGDDQDLRAMFRWFASDSAYDADFDTTRRLDPDVLDLEGWVRTR